MPDIENSRQTAEKGAEWITVKQPNNSRKNSWNSWKAAVLTVSATFLAVLPWHLLRLFFGCFQCQAFGTSVDGRRDCNPRSHWHTPRHMTSEISTGFLRRKKSNATMDAIHYPDLLDKISRRTCLTLFCFRKGSAILFQSSLSSTILQSIISESHRTHSFSPLPLMGYSS